MFKHVLTPSSSNTAACSVIIKVSDYLVQQSNFSSRALLNIQNSTVKAAILNVQIYNIYMYKDR